ncbi:MAG: glycosyltransferase [Candidatus Krumholzibacteriota bacterium]|nr:glycosyltransferase [Candidatus Krumholzibacteriota bacterium]
MTGISDGSGNNSILFFGGYDEEYPRNRIIRKGLRKIGVRVDECHADWKSRVITRYPCLTAKYLGTRERGEVFFVPEFRHKDVPLAWFLARMSGKKVVFDPLVSRYATRVLDREDATEGTPASWHNRNLDRTSMKMADLVIADTDAHARYYSEEFGIDRGKIKTLYVGFDDGEFGLCEEPPESEPFRVLFYGSYLPLHGVDTIVKSARHLSESPVSFTMVGGGQTYSIARELARGLPEEKIIFREYVRPDKLSQLIRDHHLVLGIFGTTPKTELVIPNKVFQGIASGRPVITADTPAIRELFRADRDILLVPKGEPEKLAVAIETLRSDREKRNVISRNGVGLVRSMHNPERTAEKLLSILKDSGVMR